MNYIDERITITVTGFTTSSAGLYQYNVTENNDDELLFVGNLYLEKGATSATVDITDIARTYFAGQKVSNAFLVTLTVSGKDYYTLSDIVLPFYRYPNKKATDVDYDGGTYNTFMLVGEKKADNSNGFIYQNTLLPAYPKFATDKININYLLGLKDGTGSYSFVLNYGPTQSISAGLGEILYPIDASLTVEGSVTNKQALGSMNCEVVSGTPSLSFYNNNLQYTYTTSVLPASVSYEWADGTSSTASITSFPYTLTMTNTGAGSAGTPLNDFSVLGSDGGVIINTYPKLAADGICTGTVVCQIVKLSSSYMIGITYQDCTIVQSTGLADEIKIYRSSGTRYTYTPTDNLYTLSVDGDLTIKNAKTVAGTYACKSFRTSFWQDGVCVSYGNSNGYLTALSKPIKGENYILVEYFDTSGNYRSGRVYITPRNANSNAYYGLLFTATLTDGILSGVISQSGSRSIFAHCTDTAITIGKLVCPDRYFLLWQDRLGSQQCQPFDKVDTYSEDVEGSEITNYYGKRSLYKVEVQPKWKLQTGWITDDAYRCYEGLFVSPWVKLYDGDSDILYDVILKDRNYTEKNFLNQGKLFNLEVTVEQTEKQNILF